MFDDTDTTWAKRIADELFSISPTVDYGVAHAAELVSRINAVLEKTAIDLGMTKEEAEKNSGSFWGHVFAVSAEVTEQGTSFNVGFVEARNQ